MATTSDEIAIDYLRPDPDSFWQWSDDCAEARWQDGSLIAFRSEIAAILTRIAPDGLPPFEAILLTVAATRNNWSSARRGAEASLFEKLPDINDPPTGRYVPLLEKVLDEMQRISRLPASLRNSVAAKAGIAEIAFAKSRRTIPPSETEAIVERVRPGLAQILCVPKRSSTPRDSSQRLVRNLLLLSEGLPRVTEDSIRNRSETSLDELPSPADLDDPLPTPELARRLIADLQTDAEWAGLARTARRLIAAVGIPRSLSHNEEHEAGGLSDLSNRGPFDRLLLSELANDGLTLAVRVAMNEALYLRRETPPGPPSFDRAILIDAGLRSWGMPRLYATALALAFTASAHVERRVSVLRASGGRLAEIDLATRDGLVAHLSTLEADLSSAEAITLFAARFRGSTSQVEPILIVPATTFEDPAFDAACRTAFTDAENVSAVVIAACGRDGQITLRQRSAIGEALIRTLVVSPEEILAGGDQLVDNTRKPTELPAIFAQPVFPLLLPHPMQVEQSWYTEGFGAHVIAGDGRLMRWTAPNEGAFQVNDQIPKGRLLWVSPGPIEKRIAAIISGEDGVYLVHIGQSDFRVDVISLDWGEVQPDGIATHGGVLMVIFRTFRVVRVFSMETGSEIDRSTLPSGSTWRHGRFVVTADGTHSALGYDGQSVVLQPFPPVPQFSLQLITGQHTNSHDDWMHIFEQNGKDGPFVITQRGTIVDITNATENRLPGFANSTPITNVQVSADGHRVSVYAEGTGWKRYHVSGCDAVLDSRSKTFDDRIERLISQRNLQHRCFATLGVTGRNELVLTTHKSQRTGIQMSGSEIGLHEFPMAPEILINRGFEPVESKPFRYRLREARFSNGSRALIDSRGLLHLVPADPAETEVTIVLKAGASAGWCSDGTLWGNSYFTGETGDSSRETMRRVWTNIIQPFAKGLRD